MNAVADQHPTPPHKASLEDLVGEAVARGATGLRLGRSGGRVQAMARIDDDLVDIEPNLTPAAMREIVAEVKARLGIKNRQARFQGGAFVIGSEERVVRAVLTPSLWGEDAELRL
ncbi:MAG: hypothetical protein U1E65_15410 [Myxococcota bacterium]